MSTAARLSPLSAYSKLLVLLATAGPHVRNAIAAPVVAITKHERLPPGSDGASRSECKGCASCWGLRVLSAWAEG